MLPALTRLSFQGISEYLEDLVSRIDTPALDNVNIDFFMDLDFHIPQLNQLIARVEMFKHPNGAILSFDQTMTDITINLRGQVKFTLAIHCDRLDYQVSSMTQVCRELSPHLSFVEELDMAHFATFPASRNDMDSMQWLELFHPFIAVQSLFAEGELALLIASALQDLTGDRATEVLPALCDLHLEGLEPSLWEAIQPFITARQLSNSPMAINFGKLEYDVGSSEDEVSEDDDDARSEYGISSEDDDDDRGRSDDDEPHLKGNSPRGSTLTDN